MRIAPITQYCQNTSFKSNITFDIGGSQREGSCKIYYATSKDDKQIYTAKTTVNTIGKNQFENNKDFVEQIMDKVKAIQDNNRANVRDMGYPEEENTIESMTIFIPSYTKKDSAYYLPNHKDAEDNPLKDLNYHDVRKMLIDRGVKISPKMKFRLLQDAMGTGLAMSKRLYDKGLLPVGSFYTACITGGGCGISDIYRFENKEIKIMSSGSACLPSGRRLEKVSQLGASAPALIENFCLPFGMNSELVDAIKKCHKAEFTLYNPVTFEKDIKTEKLKELLLSSKKYELIEENENSFTLGVKKEYNALYDMCRENTIDMYCDAFAKLGGQIRCRGSNGLIITGPVAQAINKASIEHYGKSISERVTKFILAKYNTYEIDKIQDTYDFRVICEDGFFIDDNTACKRLAHETKPIPGSNRFNWIILPIKKLKEPMSC